MDTEQLYKDIKARTNGEIYIGVVGPVRTGKSTFIKRFMDVMVLPRMEDEHKKERTRDELPQSAAGKTIMTTEPKFVPKDAAVIRLDQDVEVRIRLIDCVGYMVKGASGHEEAGHERMVKTPWYQEEIPFTKAAVIGTQKVIHEHATIGIVVTTDGTITDILPENYEDAEARTIRELQSIRKPFVVLVNSKKPHGQEAKEKAKKLEDTYGVKAMTVNCEQIKEEDIYDYSYFLYTYLPIYFMYVKNKLFFTSENIIPSTVCDLNCRSCLNFNPYIKKHIVDSLEEVKADIDAFFGQVDLIYRLQISGGEPFLYKELGHVLEYIYENYKDKVIRLETVTNGTIVPSDELCRILKKCKVTVFLDDYRKTLPNGEALYERVKNKLNQEEISVIYNYAEKWIRMYSENSSHEEDSEEKLESFYERCGNPWSTLRKKKITGCNYAHYAAKAGILPDDEDNYFVLTGEVDKKALLEFRLRYNEKGYVEFCKKCAGWTSINPNLEDAAIQKAKE